MGAQLDQVSGLLYANGRYYDPGTGRYLTPDHRFDPLRPGTLNPYAPLQGPGLWLLLPFVGIVLAWKGRKGAPWRVIVLVCVIGVGMSVVGCSETETSPAPTSTQLPIPPVPPTEARSSVPDAPYWHSSKYGWFDRSHINFANPRDILEQVRRSRNGGDVTVVDGVGGTLGFRIRLSYQQTYFARSSSGSDFRYLAIS